MTPLGWGDLSGRVAVWGMGIEGNASLRRLRAQGIEPTLVAAEAGTAHDGTTPVLGLDDGGADALRSADVVIKSPGISSHDPLVASLRREGSLVLSGLGLWIAEVDRSRVLAITGTKGKSTTTAIAAALLDGVGCSYVAGGNIGVCPWDPEVEQAPDWWVIEASSYQVPDLPLGPAVVAVTSLGEDHLPWHAHSVDQYHRDKLRLCTLPGVREVVANGSDPTLRSRTELLGDHVTWVTEPAGDWARHPGLLGEHNRRNAQIARTALRLLGVPELQFSHGLAAAFEGFVPLPSRLTPVHQADGVVFVDDSISTTVISALAAVASFPNRRVGLIVGGLERDIDYRPLASAARADLRIYAVPTNGPHIAAVLRASGVDVVELSGLAEAVAAAYEWARPGGVVLLSPAAASFDTYRDYRHRGEAFTEAARAITSDSQGARNGPELQG